MELRTIEVEGKTYAEVQDGKPVYVDSDGKEIAFDAVSTKATISRLFGENKSYRERFEAAEASLKQFEGITDAEAARKALEVVKNLDDKKLVDAGEVEKIKAEVGKVYEAKLTEETQKREKLEQQLHAEKIGGGFARSKFIAEKTRHSRRSCAGPFRCRVQGRGRRGRGLRRERQQDFQPFKSWGCGELR